MRWVLWIGLGVLCLGILSGSTTQLGDEIAPAGSARSYTLNDYYSTNVNLVREMASLVANMPREEVAGQLIMPAWETGTSRATLTAWICEQRVGGIMLLQKGASAADVRWLQKTATNCGHTLPLLIAMDAEPTLIAWGARSLPQLEEMPTQAALQTPEAVRATAERIHTALAARGVTVNFAPVVDGAGNEAIIAERSFGDTPEHIAHLAGAFTENAIAHGIIPTLKHFPGHGNAHGDTHKTLESVPGTLSELNNFALDDALLVMVGHLAVDGGAYDTAGVPATLSHTIMRTLLREELGYGGVTITDAMNMGAVHGTPDANKRALEAGADIILMPLNVTRAREELLRADPHALYEAAERVMRLKLVQLQATL